jgi:hypothetical protein
VVPNPNQTRAGPGRRRRALPPNVRVPAEGPRHARRVAVHDERLARAAPALLELPRHCANHVHRGDRHLPRARARASSAALVAVRFTKVLLPYRNGDPVAGPVCVTWSGVKPWKVRRRPDASGTWRLARPNTSVSGGRGQVRAAKGEGRSTVVREHAGRAWTQSATVYISREGWECCSTLFRRTTSRSGMNEWNGEETERPEKVMSATCTDSMPPRL